MSRPATSTIWVGGLPFDTNESELRQLLAKSGAVQDLRLIHDRASGVFKGFGFCRYADKASAESALHSLNGTWFGGRRMRVDLAVDHNGGKDQHHHKHQQGQQQHHSKWKQQQQQRSKASRSRPFRINWAAFPLQQLPDEALAEVGYLLSIKDCLNLGRRVFPKGSPAAAAVLGTVHALELNNRPADAPAFLSQLQQLQELTMVVSLADKKGKAGPQQGPPQLASLAGLTELSKLTVAATIETCNAQQQIKQRRRQQQLLEAVGRLTRLSELSVDCSSSLPPARQTFAPLSQLTGLESLELTYTALQEGSGLEHLTSLTGLTFLSLNEKSLADHSPPPPYNPDASSDAPQSGVEALGPLWPQLQLQQLHLTSKQLGTEAVRHLMLQPQQLRVLDVSYCKGLFPHFTQQLASLTNLQELHAKQCDLSAEDLGVIAAAVRTSLTLLDLSYTSAYDTMWPRATVGCLQHLVKLTSLQHLELQHCNIADWNEATGETEPVCAALAAALTQLTRLSIGGGWRGDPIPAADAVHLSGLSGLQDLELHDIRLGPDKVGFLGSLRNLTQLVMHECKPGAAGQSTIRAALPGLRVLKVLDLNWGEGAGGAWGGGGGWGGGICSSPDGGYGDWSGSDGDW